MPCCAFAAFLISQLLVAVAALKQLVFRSAARPATALVSNPVVEWRLGAQPTAVAAASAWAQPAWNRRHALGRGLAVAALIEMALLTGTLYSARIHFARAETSAANAGQPAAPHCEGR
ncbi:MAG: hypothetical protein HZA65_05805 [Rhodocyclales bacterium]|nr:hypothetical protein [Rhodocyclales bacterium]